MHHDISVLWPLQLACCAVLHFSWFMVVSCPVRDSCSLTAAQTLLVSSADPGVKLRFPPDSTLGTRSITLQVARRFSLLCFVFLSSCGFCSLHDLYYLFIFWRCCKCPSQRCRLCVKILRPASALSSASRRVPTLTSCSPSKFRSPYHLESQVSEAKYCLYYWKRRGLSHQSCLVWINCGFLSSAYKPHINENNMTVSFFKRSVCFLCLRANCS